MSSITTVKTTKTVSKPSFTFSGFSVGQAFLRPDTGNVYLKTDSNTAVKIGQVGNNEFKQRTRSGSYFDNQAVVPVDATLTIAV